MRTKLFAIILIIAAIFLTACTDAEPQQNLVFLYKQEQTADGFTGVDNAGNVWTVSGQHDTAYSCAWVRYTGDGFDITADSAWLTVECDKAAYGEAMDTCTYDHDGDGVEELLVIARHEDSEPGQFELAVWDGDTCEASTYFYGGGSLEAMAFDWEDGNLVIRSVNWPYGDDTWTIDTYNIRWQEGGPAVSKAAN